MPLPTTNISLNAIHVEVGGTSGTQVSLNDADVRGIGSPDATYAGGDGINTTSGTTISIGEFRNAQDAWSTTLTVGVLTTKGGSRYGMISSGSYGSLGDYTVDTLSNAQINLFATAPSSSSGLYIGWDTILPTGWTSVTIDSTTINRTSFSVSGTLHYINTGSYITPTSGATQTITFNI